MRITSTKISEDIIRMIIKEGNLVLVGSVSPSGMPNVSPRYVLGILGEERLLFADGFENKTFHNINAWPKVSVAVFDKQGGYQLKGDAEQVTDPELISQAESKLKEFGVTFKPKKVWTLVVREIYSMERSDRSRHPIAPAYN